MKGILNLFVGIVLMMGSIKSYSNDPKYTQDVVSIASISGAYYETVSGPIGEARDFDRLRNLFHPKANLTYSFWCEESQEWDLMHMTVEDYIGKLDYLDKRGFYEEEIYSKSESFGTIVQSISSYKFWMEDQTVEGRGISSFNFCFDGDRYWILSMVWQMESDRFTIPDKYQSN